MTIQHNQPTKVDSSRSVPRIQIALSSKSPIPQQQPKQQPTRDRHRDDQKRSQETPNKSYSVHHHGCNDDNITLADWPTSSSRYLPPLSPFLQKGLKEQSLNYTINDECTSLKVAPSGKHFMAGFADGTLRVFDLTGRRRCPSQLDASFSSSSTSDNDDTTTIKTRPRMGVVVCQIHARGVHTSLLMDVDCTQDGQWCFGGVLKGSTELVAVHLGRLEDSESTASNILDLVTVHRHTDAKLRGLGACTRVQGIAKPKYLLFTGKSIKNIHIWSFEPPLNDKKEPSWQCLYDTQTSGTSITLLHFRYDQHGLLQGISKSENQKLRVWDLSFEQHQGNPEHACVRKQSVVPQFRAHPFAKTRPKRPRFCDVVNSESALAVCGKLCICGGSQMYNQMTMVNVEDPKAVYNHTDLALPGANDISRRQQRGELKSISKVAGLASDAGHAILELSDGSMLRYIHTDGPNNHGVPRLCTLSSQDGLGTLASGVARTTCVDRIGASGQVVVVVATYNTFWGRGSIVLRHLDEDAEATSGVFWGFSPTWMAQHCQMGHVRAIKSVEPFPDQTLVSSSVLSDKTKPAIASNHPSTNSAGSVFENIAAVVDTPETQRTTVSLVISSDASLPSVGHHYLPSGASRVSPEHKMSTPANFEPNTQRENDPIAGANGSIEKYLAESPSSSGDVDKVSSGTGKDSEVQSPTTRGRKCPMNQKEARSLRSPTPSRTRKLAKTTLPRSKNRTGASSNWRSEGDESPSRKSPSTEVTSTKIIHEQKKDSYHEVARARAIFRTKASKDASSGPGNQRKEQPKGTSKPGDVAGNHMQKENNSPKAAANYGEHLSSDQDLSDGSDKTTSLKAAPSSAEPEIVNNQDAKMTGTSLPDNCSDENQSSMVGCFVEEHTDGAGKERHSDEDSSEKRPYSDLSSDSEQDDAEACCGVSKKQCTSSPRTSCATPENVEAAHLSARERLLAHHRTAYGLIQNRFQAAAKNLARTVSDKHSLEHAKASLKHLVYDYKEILDETLRQHEMEALALVASQTTESCCVQPPCVAVSFPFTDLFDEATTMIERAYESNHKHSRSHPHSPRSPKRIQQQGQHHRRRCHQEP